MLAKEKMCSHRTKSVILSKVLQKDVTADDIQNILGENLSFGSESLKLGILYDSLNFALKECIYAESVEIFVNFFHNFLKMTVCEGLPIKETMNMLRRKMDELSLHIKNPTVLMSCVDYIMSTIIQHYNLMVYIMCNERTFEIHENKQTVSIPEDILNLKDGIELGKWNLDKRLKTQEMNFQDKDEELSKTFKGMLKETKEQLDQLFSTVGDIEMTKPLRSTEITGLLTEIIVKQKEATALDIEMMLEKSKGLLQHHYEKIIINNQFQGKTKTAR